MGLDLALLPMKGPQQMGEVGVLCQDRLNFDRDYSIFDQLRDIGNGNKPTIKTSPIPPQMWVELFEEEGIVRRRNDRGGVELTFVYAQQLKKLKIRDDATPKNKAIKAFIEALPDDTPVILFW